MNTPTTSSPESAASLAPVLCDQPQQPRIYTAARHAATVFDLETWLLDHPLLAEPKAYVREALEVPSHRPNGFSANTVLHADANMPFVITAASRNYEFPTLLTVLARPDVLCVVDQSGTVIVHAKSSDGAPFTFRYTPDFLVITLTGIEIIEVKPADQMADLCLKSPNRYQCAADGTYRSKPLEAFFKAWGFSFHIVTDRSLSPNFVQASLMLQSYVNAQPPVPFTSEELQSVHDAVKATPGLMVSELPIAEPARRAELTLHLLANAQLFSHLSTSDIQKPQELRLYTHYRDEAAFAQLFKSCSTTPANLEELGYQLLPGAEIALRNRSYAVVDVSPRFVRLKGPDDKERQMSHQALLDLRPRIHGIHGAQETLLHRLRTVSFEDRMVYLRRRAAIAPYLPGGRLSGVRPLDRSIRRWRDAFLYNERSRLPGDLALFPHFNECGESEPRIAPDVLAKLRELKETSYKKEGGGHNVPWLHSQLIAAKASGEIHGELPSLRTIYRHCANVPKYEHALATGGKRNGAPYEPIHSAPSVMGSPHGQRNWQVAHIDTTPLDLSTTHSRQDHEIQKQSLCRMMDAFDGETVASVLFSGSVKAMRIRELIWDCWRRHNRLPRIIVCDWGPEHNNAWIQKSCAFLGITLIFRPKSEPRKGAPVETTFSTTCRQLIHNLTGNTRLLQKARLITRAMDPKKFTLWSAEDLNQLIEDDLMLRNELPRQRKPSPEAIALAVNQKFGPAPVTYLTTEQIRIALLPFVDGPLRKVSARGTVQCLKRIYHSKELQAFAGMQIDLRYDPANPNVIYAIPPRGRRTIECHVFDQSALTKDIIEAAEKIDQAALGPSPFKNVTPAQARRAEIVARVDAAEKSMLDEKSDTRRKRPARINPRSPKAIKSNLIDFTLTPRA